MCNLKSQEFWDQSYFSTIIIRNHICYPINSINYCMMPVISIFNAVRLAIFIISHFDNSYSIVIINGLTIICRQWNSHYNNSYKIDVVITEIIIYYFNWKRVNIYQNWQIFMNICIFNFFVFMLCLLGVIFTSKMGI